MRRRVAFHRTVVVISALILVGCLLDESGCMRRTFFFCLRQASHARPVGTPGIVLVFLIGSQESCCAA